MVAVMAEGNTTADGTEQTLLDTTVVATYQPVISLANMLAGDTLVVRLKSTNSIFGTPLTFYEQTFSGVQTGINILQVGPPIAGSRYAMTIQQTAGTFRAYRWRVDALGSAVNVATGSVNLSSAVENNFFVTATPGIYTVSMSLSAMQAGEGVVLRAYEPVESSGTMRLAYEYVAPIGVQVTPNINMVSLPISGPYGAQFSIQQTHTNSRGYNYRVYRVSD